MDTKDHKRKHAEHFMKHFIKSFDKTEKKYIEATDPEYESNSKNNSVTNGIGTVAGGASGLVVGVGANVGIAATKKVGETVHHKFRYRDKAKKILTLLVNYSRKERYEILADGIKEIFKSYEEVLMKIEDLCDLEKVAVDAKSRLMNYLNSASCSEFSKQTIWKGVLEGDSKQTTLAKFTCNVFGSKGHKVHANENDPAMISKAKNRTSKLARATAKAFTTLSKTITANVFQQTKQIPEERTVEHNTSDIFLYSKVLIFSDESLNNAHIYSKDQKGKFDYLPYRLACDEEDVEYLESIGCQLVPTISGSQLEDSYRHHRLTEEEWSDIILTIIDKLLLGEENCILKEVIEEKSDALCHNIDDITSRLTAHNLSPDGKKDIPFLPFPLPDKNFTGRTDLCCDVLNILFPYRNVDDEENQYHQDEFVVVCVHGLSGHGKTHTARRIALMCNCENVKLAEVVYIEAESEEDILSNLTRELKNQAQEVNNIHDDPVLLVRKLFDLFKSRKDERFVVVFDNITNNLAKKYLPLDMVSENVAIILTSAEKIDLPNATVKNYLVDILEPSEARDLIKKIIKGNDDEADVLQLVEESCGIPILLCIMAAAIVETRENRSMYSIKEYLSLFKSNLDKILQYPQNPDLDDNLNLQYQKSLLACVRTAVQILNESKNVCGKLACRLFEHLLYFLPSHIPITYFAEHVSINSLYFSPDNIPIKYFSDHITAIRREVEEIQQNQPDLDLKCDVILIEGFRLLSKLSLVKGEIDMEDNGIYISIHRLVQIVSRIMFSDNEKSIITNLLQDMPRSSGHKEDTAISYPYEISNIWSHAARHSDLVHEYKSKLSFKKLADFGRWNLIAKIIEHLNGTNILVKKLLMKFEFHSGASKKNTLVISLENNIKFADWLIEILKNSENFDETYSREKWDKDMFRTLNFVIIYMSFDTFKRLHAIFNIDVNYQNKPNVDTFLNNAILRRNMKVARYLFSEKNADPRIPGYRGYTALHWLACRLDIQEDESSDYDREAEELANEILHKYPELIKVKDGDGCYPFMRAAQNSSSKALRIILEKDDNKMLNINETDSDGRTALQMAMESFNNMSSIRILMNHHANLHFRNEKTGNNAWHLAIKTFEDSCINTSEKFALLRLLQDKNVDETVKDIHGNSYLHHLVASFPHMQSVEVQPILTFLEENKLLGVIGEVNNGGMNVIMLAEKLRVCHCHGKNFDIFIDFITSVKKKSAAQFT